MREYAEFGRKRRARADRRRRYRLELGAARRLRGRGAQPDADLQREGAVRPRPPGRLHRPPRRGERRARAGGAEPLPAPSPASSASRTCAPSPPPPAARPPTAPISSPAARRRCGTRIQVLSGQQEAELAANGIMMGFRSPDGIAGDLGGGSLEIIDVERRRLAPGRHAAARRPAAARCLRRQDRQGRRHRRRADRAACPGSTTGATGAFYAVGGTWRAIARLHMEQTDYPLHVMHGYAMPTEEAIDFCEEIRKTKKLSAHAGHRGDLHGRGARCCPTARWCSSAC